MADQPVPGITNRERIIRTLLCQPADRAPWGVGLGFAPWGETHARWVRESGIRDLDVAAFFGYDTGFLVVPGHYGTWPHFEAKIIEEDEGFVVSTDARGLTMRNRRDGGSMPEWLDHPVKSEDDWKRYKEERLQPLLEQRIAPAADFFAAATEIDAPIQVGAFPWGVFGTPRDLLGTTEYLLSFCTQPELVHDIMDTYTSLWLLLYEAFADRIRIDHIHIWEDMSFKNGSLISPALVEEFMMPHYDRIADFARRREIPLISVDSDGDVSQLIPIMMRHGMNWMFPFEVQAGMDIERVRDMYPTLGILGGLDKNALYEGKEAMQRELDKAERMLAKGGYVPGFDHLIPPNASWENWCYFMEHLKRLVWA